MEWYFSDQNLTLFQLFKQKISDRPKNIDFDNSGNSSPISKVGLFKFFSIIEPKLVTYDKGIGYTWFIALAVIGLLVNQ